MLSMNESEKCRHTKGARSSVLVRFVGRLFPPPSTAALTRMDKSQMRTVTAIPPRRNQDF